MINLILMSNSVQRNKYFLIYLMYNLHKENRKKKINKIKLKKILKQKKNKKNKNLVVYFQDYYFNYQKQKIKKKKIIIK